MEDKKCKLKSKEKYYIIILIVIILAQVLYKIYVGYHKEDFFVDELSSYGLMNYSQAYMFEKADFSNNWHNKEYFDDYLVISKDEAWDWSPIYKNQMEDFHPPLYYLLLRIAASFTIGGFSKWTGLSLNIMIFICCAIALYKIGNLLFKDKKIALVLVFIYGFSKFSTENTLFIRMYQLLELQIILLLGWHIKNEAKLQLEIKELLKLIILIILGSLTHYYYIIFLIGICIVKIINYIKRKQFKNLMKYIIAICIAEVLISFIFPGYTEQLKKNFVRCNDTSIESSEVETEASVNILIRETKYLNILDNHMFNLKITYVILGLTIISIILLILNTYKNIKMKRKSKYSLEIIYIIVPMIFYWGIITTTSPYIDVRYILPFFILLLISIVYMLTFILKKLIKSEKSIIIVLMIISLLYVLPFYGNTELEYQYSSNKEAIEKIQKYKEVPCIYIYTDKDMLKNNFLLNLNYIRQFENVYVMNKTEFSTENLEKVLDRIDTSKGIIIYDEGMGTNDRAKQIVKNMDEFSKYKKIVRFTEDEITKGVVTLIY